MLRNYMGIINLEESEKDIRSLTNFRPIGTIPVAGRYRVIDFTLSNMVNAGLRHISVFCKKETNIFIYPGVFSLFKQSQPAACFPARQHHSSAS